MAKIKFVAAYKRYNEDHFEVTYESGRLRSIIGQPPMTVQRFIITAKSKEERFEKIGNYPYTLYKGGAMV